MKASSPISTIFVDVGGVLLTNGWDRSMRKQAAETFGLDYAEMDERHHPTFNTFEEGKLSLEEYLDRLVFYQSRPFSREEFKAFMFARSQPYPEMLALIRSLKARCGLKVAAVNNEGRELNAYRIHKFRLVEFVDFFVSSCFVHFRKPDADIYRIALDVAQVTPEEVVYIDDRALFVEVAQDLDIRGIHHRLFESTKTALMALGLSI